MVYNVPFGEEKKKCGKCGGIQLHLSSQKKKLFPDEERNLLLEKGHRSLPPAVQSNMNPVTAGAGIHHLFKK